jgi:hypothetical protein
MKRSGLAVIAVLLLALAVILEREVSRGSFDPVERAFVSWLAANAGGKAGLPPLTLVLYDEEASEMAGTGRMALLDGVLFARAASRLGAMGAGIEGLSGDPTRMIEAAGGMPVFGGFDPASPPGNGWTPVRGVPGGDWDEVPGLAGRPGRFARGFLAPPTGGSGAREIRLAGRTGDRAIPSFLALAWAVANGWRWSELSAEPPALEGPDARLIMDRSGAVRFWPSGAPATMTMSELLVAAEQFEREGGPSPLRGHVVVLAPATSDVTRVAADGMGPVTPAEQRAQVWESVRTDRLFLPPAWWYPLLVALWGTLVVAGPARRSNGAALLAGSFSLLVFALLALGVFGSTRVVLPLVPASLTLVSAMVLGRLGHARAWFGK